MRILYRQRRHGGSPRLRRCRLRQALAGAAAVALTAAQQRVLDEIDAGPGQPAPDAPPLQGDVGSGKRWWRRWRR